MWYGKAGMERKKSKMKKEKLIKNVLYEIEWIDTFGYSGWYTEEEIGKKKISICLTVGYLIKETVGFIIVAMSREIGNEEELAPYNSPKWIPKGYIQNIRRL